MIPDAPHQSGLCVVPFSAWHLVSLDLRPLDRKALGPFQLIELAKRYEAEGFSWSAIRHGRPICCFGVLPLWPGVATMWLATTDGVLPVRKSLHRYALQFVAEMENRMGLWRIEATVLPEHTASAKWLAALGFAYEGPRQFFGPDGSTFNMVARINEANLPKRE